MNTTRTSSIRRHRRLVVTVAILVGTLAAACGDDAERSASGKGWSAKSRPEVVEGAGADGTEADSASEADGASAERTAPVGGSTGGGSPAGATNPGGGSAGGGGTPAGGGPAPAAPAPIIDAFTTPGSIDCHNGDYQPFTATWATRNTTKVTISIDGPGIYDTYGPSGEATLPFTCTSPHTFLLTAYGADGRTATSQVTLHPRNVEAQGSSDEDPPEDL